MLDGGRPALMTTPHLDHCKGLVPREDPISCVRAAGDTGCEGIHKEKKMQRAKFCFRFPKRGKGLDAEKCTRPEGPGL